MNNETMMIDAAMVEMANITPHPDASKVIEQMVKALEEATNLIRFSVAVANGKTIELPTVEEAKAAIKAGLQWLKENK